MSRNDTYLSLCLEQASLSSLHYRHGCIIVRGGKVIGKGFNGYRSGYHGGALTTGQLSSGSAVKSPAIQALKGKCKKAHARTAVEHRRSLSNPRKPTKTYVAFENQVEGSGGGCLANTLLSMHSEMMAIHSALSLSSVISCQGTARSSQWLQKPSFKLPSRSKRRNRLQRLKAFADAVCAEQAVDSAATLEHGGLSQAQQSRFEAGTILQSGCLRGRLQEGAARSARGVAVESRPCQLYEVPANEAVEESLEVSEQEVPETVSVRPISVQRPSSSSPPPGPHPQCGACPTTTA